LMFILATLAEENGRAQRRPSPLDTGLHVPNVGLVRVIDGTKAGQVEAKGRSVVLFPLIHAIDDQACRDMQDRGADLVDGGIPTEVLEGSTPTAKDRQAAATCRRVWTTKNARR